MLIMLFNCDNPGFLYLYIYSVHSLHNSVWPIIKICIQEDPHYIMLL